MATSHATDAMIRRLEKELEERNTAASAIIANAQDSERDLNDSEKQTLGGLRDRMGSIKEQLDELESTADLATQTQERLTQFDHATMAIRRKSSEAPIEYRSAGAYMMDYIQAQNGSTAARDRLDVYNRAAAHQQTLDNLGIIPDPVIGDLVNFIDANRPLVNFLGARNLPGATWYRPKVTQHTATAVQGVAGLAADEKAELTSQKMLITRLTGTAVTYGGYVNVSRQNIDFSSPDALDAVINDLAAQYAIDTEAAVGALIAAQAHDVELTPVAAGTDPSAAELNAALWTAVGNIYTATQGVGRLALVVQPAVLGKWAALYAPVNPQNSQSQGFNAVNFGSGLMGSISGIPVLCSAGYPTVANHFGALFSTAGIEVYEQRVGALQATEPSVLGVQVAYAGYFSPMLIETNAVQRVVNLA